jgi:hypothetical protein
MNSQIDYPSKISNNSYNEINIDHQIHNQFNRKMSYNKQQVAVNFWGIKTLKPEYATNDDNLAYRMERRITIDPKLILRTPLIMKQFH